MSDKRVVVVGGSLVGASAALFLQNRGVEVHVYEMHADAHNRAGGVIGLEHPALQALELVGIGQDEIVPVSTETVLSVTWRGGVELERQASIYPGRTSTWTRLYGALVKRLAEGTYHASHELYDVTEADSVAYLHFTNGNTVVADVVIGADGRNSVMRKLFDPGRRLHYAGYVAHGGEYPQCPPDLAAGFVRLHSAGALFNTYPRETHGDAVDLDWRFYVNQTPAHYATLFRRSDRELAEPNELTYIHPHRITGDVRRFVDRVARLLLPEREADIVAATETRSAAPVLDIEPPVRLVHQFGAARVILMGDAAGPVHPSTARGANAGIEQAHDLSTVLHQHFHRDASLDAGLKAYERRQLPPVRCALREGPILGARMGLGVWAHPTN